MTVTLPSEDASAVLVLFPSPAFAQNLPEGVAITDWSAYAITLTSERPNFAAMLYEHGARIVLPSGLLGCGPENRRYARMLSSRHRRLNASTPLAASQPIAPFEPND